MPIWVPLTGFYTALCTGVFRIYEDSIIRLFWFWGLKRWVDLGVLGFRVSIGLRVELRVESSFLRV